MKRIALLTVFSVLLSFSSKAFDGDENYTLKDDASGKTVAEQLKIEKTGNKSTDWAAELASRIMVHGYAQGGYDFKNVDGTLSNTFKFTRAYFWLNGRITDRWSVLYMLELGGKTHEFYTDYRVTNNNLLTVRLGQYKYSSTLENPISPCATEVIDVCSEGVTFLCASSDPLLGLTYGRDLGLTIYGETDNKMFRYELGLMNGQGMGNKDLNNQKDVLVNLQYRPVTGLNIVGSAYFGTGCAVATSIFNPTINVGDNYRRNRYSAGFDYKSKPFNVRAEYLQGLDGDVTSVGGYVTGSIRLRENFDFVGSYDYFNFNTDLSLDQHKLVAGLQYWFYKGCRIQAQYVYKNAVTDYRTFFDNTKGQHAILCQVQFRIN